MLETFIQHPKYDRLLVGSNGTLISSVNWIQLKTVVTKKGYEELKYRIGSRSDNTRKTLNLKVHRLVAEIFIGNYLKKPTINHIDGNKLNQDYRNLEWATWKENNRHAFKLGLRVGKPISKEHRKKINEGIKSSWAKNKLKRKRDVMGRFL